MTRDELPPGLAARGEPPMRAVPRWRWLAVRPALALVGVAAAAALVVGSLR